MKLMCMAMVVCRLSHNNNNALHLLEILLYFNLSVYVCEVSSWKLESQLLLIYPTRTLYLWSDHHANSGRRFFVLLDKSLPCITHYLTTIKKKKRNPNSGVSLWAFSIF